MTPYSIEDLKPGMTVVFIDQSLNTHPTCWVASPMESNEEAMGGKTAMIVAIEPNKPGKVIALCFKDVIGGGHSCDERVPHGHGAYALPEHLYSKASWEAHKAADKTAAVEQTAISEMLKGFLTP